MADGTRLKVSPIGVSHVLHPDRSVSETRDCRWSPPAGDLALCAQAPGGAAAFRALRLVPRVLAASVLLCLVAAALLFIPQASRGPLRAMTIAAAMLAALGAPVLFGFAAPRALAALQGVAFGVGGTRGTLQVAVAAAVLAGVAAALALAPAGTPTLSRRRIRWVGALALLLLPVLAFLTMFPLPGGLAFAAAGIALGLGAGKLAAGRPAV